MVSVELKVAKSVIYIYSSKLPTPQANSQRNKQTPNATSKLPTQHGF